MFQILYYSTLLALLVQLEKNKSNAITPLNTYNLTNEVVHLGNDKSAHLSD